MPEFRTVTREEFLAVIGPLNVHPRAEPDRSVWEDVVTRKVVGLTTPGYKNGWTPQGKAPKVYKLAIR